MYKVYRSHMEGRKVAEGGRGWGEVGGVEGRNIQLACPQILTSRLRYPQQVWSKKNEAESMVSFLKDCKRGGGRKAKDHEECL